jgi:hypothetical protein
MPDRSRSPRRFLPIANSLQIRSQVAQAFLPNYAANEQAAGRRAIYIITCAHPVQEQSQDGFVLIAPETLTRAEILQKVLDSCAHPIYADAKSLAKGKGVELVFVGIFLESHKANEEGLVHQHYHILVRATAAFRFKPVKAALLQRHGLAAHFGCTHEGYWSVVRYVHVPSPDKPKGALDATPLLWAAQGEHPCLDDCCHEPLTAAAIRKKNVTKQLNAAEEGKEEKVTELDVWPLVVHNKFRNGPDAQLAHKQLITVFVRMLTRPPSYPSSRQGSWRDWCAPLWMHMRKHAHTCRNELFAKYAAWVRYGGRRFNIRSNTPRTRQDALLHRHAEVPLQDTRPLAITH